MSLWIYSSGDGEQNANMDEELMAIIERKRPRFTFVAADEHGEEYYDEFIDRFSCYSYINFQMLDPGEPISHQQRRRALSADLVYLSGGNTFHFHQNLKQTDIIADLKDYVKAGKPLAGHSAGGIVMSPNIRMASVPEFDRDENDIDLSDWRSMRLVPFEVFPHYVNHRDYSNVLTEMSKLSQNQIYAISDGAGICRRPGSSVFYGRVWLFTHGQKVVINR